MWPKFERLEHPPKGLPDGTETSKGNHNFCKSLCMIEVHDFVNRQLKDH